MQKTINVLLHAMMLYDVIQGILLPEGEYHNLLTSRFYLAKVWIFLVIR